MSVFVIVNEWTDIDNSTSSEIVGDRYFESMEEAWQALSLICASYGSELDQDGFSFSLEGHDPHLQFEEFYIQELTKGDS